LKAGAAYVPIDAAYPHERINLMIDDINASVIITTTENNWKLSIERPIDIIEIDGDWSAISQQPATTLQTEVKPNNLAYIIYTSGSTGRPKGVMVEHGNVVSLVKGVDYVSFTDDDILLSTGSPSFDATTFEYWGMLLNGGQLVLCSEERLLNSKLLKEEIESRQVTKMWFTSSWFNQLVDTDITAFQGLQTILAGGEKLSEKHIEKLRKTYPQIEIINGYGPTENTTFSLTYKIADSEITSIPIGRPLNNRTAFVLNDAHQLVPIGVAGEICLGGAGLSRGYLNREELTAEKFIRNPFDKQGTSKLYKTGDLGRWLRDGDIEYLGRKDEQVKIRGFRIELGEIETVLQKCELVSQAVVIAADDEVGSKRLIAYIVPDETFDRDAIVDYLQKRLPAYMVPALLVEMESLPLTSNGKVDKRALPNPDASKLLTNEYVAARNEFEAKMVDIWKDLLELDRVGIRDDFFDLGGHSLLAIRLISAIRKELQVELSINALFEYPT
ncbi:MAG: non-ribosomal peptide synthetase, partial [Segetibacter sp.]